METDELITKAGILIEKFVSAAIPVAKQAYEIGLMTLQVDALATLVPAFLAVLLSLFLLGRVKRLAEKEKSEYVVSRAAYLADPYRTKMPENQADFVSVAWFNIFAVIPGLIGTTILCNVWLWVKLFAPQLWLAHTVIEKVLK